VRTLDLKLVLLPVFSGLLSFASLPAAGQSYLAWIAQVPLILFVLRSQSGSQAFFGGIVAGFVQFSLLLVWIPAVLVRYGNLPAPVAWLLFFLLMITLGLYPGVACAVTGISVRRAGRNLALFFPFVWVTTELLRSYTPFGGFPWLLAGYSQTENLRIIQISDITGVYGVSFLIGCCNVGIAWLIDRGARDPRNFLPALGAAGLLTVCLAYGNQSLQRWEGSSPRYTTALLQGNISADDSDGAMRYKFGQGYTVMAAGIKEPAVDLLALPESPAPVSFQSDPEYRRRLQDLARHYRLGVVFSNIAFSEAPGDERYFNSAYFLGQDGTVRGRYDKIHLVPFGEYVPLKSMFSFMQSITREVSDFSPGSGFLTVDTPAGRMSAIICFEAVFPELVRKFAAQGSQLIVNLTNDGWYGDSAAPYQHLAMARWRAVENRRYLLRAANSGISAIIDPAGRVTASTRLLRKDICVGRFDFVSYRSFYARRGDLAAVLCAIICCLALAWSCVRSRVSVGKRGRG
jgi:apolipoprotein N-acyltransferase